MVNMIQNARGKETRATSQLLEQSEQKLSEQNEKVHSNFSVSELVRDIKEHLGLIIVAEAGHGKSFTASRWQKEQ